MFSRPHGIHHHRPRYADAVSKAAWERTQEQRRDSSQSSMSAFDEVESLDLSHSRSQSTESSLPSRGGSRGSVSLSSRGSASQSFDMDYLDQAALERGISVEQQRDPHALMQGAYQRLSGRFDPTQHDYITKALARYAMMRRHYSTDRQSTRSTSSRTSRTNSSWDEVESLDLGGQHEVDIDPSLFVPLDKNSYMDQFTTKGANYWSSASPKSRSRSNSNGMKKKTSSSNAKNSHSSHDELKEKKRRDRDLIVADRAEDEEFSGRRHSFGKRSDSVDRESTSSERSGKSWSKVGKNVVEQLLQYKLGGPSNQNSPSDSISTASSYPNSGSGGDLAGKLPYENEYEYFVRMRRQSQDSVTSGYSGPRSGFASRAMSMESSSSSFESVPPDLGAFGGAGLPAFGGNAAVKAARAAEDVLMNLGFVGQDSFIPERFARNWYDKVLQARRKQMEAYQQQEIADMLEGLETSSRSQSGRSSPMRRHGNKSDFLHKLDINSRNSSMRRSKFRRAATIVTYHEDNKKTEKANLGSQGSFEKQDSIDQLKFVLERHATILNAGMDRRRKQFAGTRQKSLPLCLETLSEEDEGRSSKGGSFEKSKMKSFLEEEEGLSRSSSKDSGKGKHRDSLGSESSAMPTSSVYSSGTSSDQEDGDENTKKFNTFEVLRNISTNKSLDADPNVGVSQVLFQNTNGTGHFLNHINPVMPLLQRQASLDNIQLGSYPNLTVSRLSAINENSKPTLTYQEAIATRAEVTKALSLPAATVPSIVVSSHKALATQSSSSLEVADIFERRVSGGSADSMSEDEPIPGGGSRRGSSGRTSPKPPVLKVEPAMISVNAVSLDVEDGDRRSSVSMLLAPSPSNSMITSPIPVSPVTVIELDHLDNQDSMDSGDSAPHATGDNPTLLLTPEAPDSLHPIAEEEMHSSDQSRSTSFDDAPYLSDTAFSRYSSAKNSFDEPSLKDSGIFADDGKLSPIALFPSNVTFTSHLDTETLKEAMNSRSDSFQSAQESTSSEERRTRQMSVEESAGTMSPRDMRDACVQEDDGTLSPIMFNPTLYNADYQLTEDVFFVSDKGIQYSLDWEENGKEDLDVEKITTASQTIFKWHENCDTSYQSFISTDDNFEPMCYYLDTSCQTDISGNVNGDANNNSTNNSSETVLVKFQSIPHFQMLCSHCQKSIQMSTSTASMDMPLNSPSNSSLDTNRKSMSLGSRDSLDVHWRSRDSVDSSGSGKKTLDTIIERLSKKTNLIRQRSKSKSASLDSQRHGDIVEDNIEKKSGQIPEERTETSATSKIEERKEAKSSQRTLPRSPTYVRSTSDNFEHRRSEHVAFGLAENDIVVSNTKCSAFADSRNSSASGSVSAPVSQNVSRNMSVDSRRSSTGSRRGSLVRQQCIEPSTVLMNMKDIDSRDLESGSDDDEDVFHASRSRNYGDEYRRLKKTSPRTSHVELEGTTVVDRNPVQYVPQKPSYAFDFDRMPSRFRKDSSSRVRVQKKSKLKSKHSNPNFSSLSSSGVSRTGSKDSLERDQLASSIATDLFQHIGIKPGLTRRQILDEIAMDYLVMKAVNRTLDQMYSSGELSDGLSSKGASRSTRGRKASGTSTDDRSSKIMTTTSFESSDTNSEVSHRGRDAFLKSAPEAGEAFSRLSPSDGDDEDNDTNLYLSQFSTSHVGYNGNHYAPTDMMLTQRGGHNGHINNTSGNRLSPEMAKMYMNDTSASKATSSVSSQDGETNYCVLLALFDMNVASFIYNDGACHHCNFLNLCN